jgi:hypothetical protein
MTTNLPYKQSLITLSNVSLNYSTFARTLSSLRDSIPGLEATSRRLMTEWRTAASALSTTRTRTDSTTSTISGYTVAIPLLRQAELLTSTTAIRAGQTLQESQLYYTLAQFYVSSNDLRKSVESLQGTQTQAGGAMTESTEFLRELQDPVVKAAYEMAKHAYYQLGGSLELVKSQYNSTVTGIGVYEENAFGIIQGYSQTAIDSLNAIISSNDAASRAEDTRILRLQSSVSGYTTMEAKYKESSILVFAQVSLLTSTLSTSVGRKTVAELAYADAESTVKPLKHAYDDLPVSYTHLRAHETLS